MEGKGIEKIRRKESFRSYFRNHKMLYFMTIPMLAYLFFFCYLPLWGISLGFREYFPGMPLFPWQGEIQWVGLKYFITMFQKVYTGRAFANTIIISLLITVAGFVSPIMFALLVNELRHRGYKKIVQTVSYLPYFISAAVIGGLVHSFLNPADGIINQLVVAFGGKSENYLANPDNFRTIYVIIHIWQTFGWGSILYLANISSINPELYESAYVDGGGRWQSMWHITLPGIKPTMFILLILSMGGVLGGGNFEIVNLLYNISNAPASSTLAVYIYRDGFMKSQFSIMAALSLFSSAVGLALTWMVNTINKKITGFGLW